MYYLFYGSDRQAARTAARELRERLHAKRPDAQQFTLTDETFSGDALDELIYAQGLFQTKHIVVLDGVLESADAAALDARLEAMQASPHVFVHIEADLPKKRADTLAAYARRAVAYTREDSQDPRAQQRERFALADALGQRDRQGLWVGVCTAFRDGVAPEELHGLLFWQVKTMQLAATCTSAGEAGLKPYPFKKARGFVKNYREAEITDMLERLVRVYHDGHRGIEDIAVGLERFALTL